MPLGMTYTPCYIYIQSYKFIRMLSVSNKDPIRVKEKWDVTSIKFVYVMYIVLDAFHNGYFVF